jgi:hypothetical protein
MKQTALLLRSAARCIPRLPTIGAGAAAAGYDYRTAAPIRTLVARLQVQAFRPPRLWQAGYGPGWKRQILDGLPRSRPASIDLGCAPLRRVATPGGREEFARLVLDGPPIQERGRCPRRDYSAGQGAVYSDARVPTAQGCPNRTVN